MNNWNPRLHELFLAACELPSDKSIEDFLNRECGTDTELRKDVESLIHASDAAGDFLAEPIDRNVLDQVNMSILQRAVGSGSIVDRYKLLEEIGEGGFGIVYLAEQTEPVRRRVALKVLKHGMDTREIVARFEAERQAIAMMNHPNIASILDAGTTSDGRPYFVMDLVQGIPMTEFCNEAKLSISMRLDLFSTICDAVQHAHQKGVIHRDLKPSNVLVTMHGDQPVPIIIDFGIAKAIDQPLTTRTLFTRFGQMVGTPQYMSPEQSGISGIDVDTRSDVYSLGVMLYELLTDLTPLDCDQIKEAAVGEIAKLIQEEEPLTPSIRLSRLGKRLPIVCQQRSSDAKRLSQLLRGDLDWIVMKAIEKNRDRRYGSAAGLGDDIRRFKSNEPVEARRPTTLYRMSKFAKRHKFQFALAAIFSLGLVAGLVGTTFAWFEAAQARSEETVQRRAAEQNEAVLQQNLYNSIMARAEMTFRDGKIPAVRALLNQCPEQLRGWEWHQLKLRSAPRRFTPMSNAGPIGNEEEIISLRTPRYSDAIVATNTKTGETRTIYEGTNRLDAGMFCKDASLFVCFSYSDSESTPSVMLYDLGEDRVRWKTEIAAKPDGLVICRDGTKIAVTHQYGSLQILDPDNGLLLQQFFPKDRGYVSLSPDGTLVAQSGEIWNTNTGKRVLVLDDDDNYINTNAFSNGTLYAKAGLTGKITLWDVSSGKKVTEFRGHDSWVASLSFSSDGKRLVSGGADSSIRLWDVDTGELITFVGNHDAAVHGVKFNEFDRKINSWSGTNGYRSWQIEVNDTFTIPHLSIAAFQTVEKDLVVTIGLGGDIRYWDWQTGQLQKVVFADSAGILVARAHRSGKWLATVNGDGFITLRELRSGRILRELYGAEPTRIELLAFAHDSNLLVGAGKGSFVWNVETGELVRSFPDQGKGSMTQMAITPDGRYYASKWKRINIEPRSRVRVIEVDSGTEVCTIPQDPNYVDAIEFISLKTGPNGEDRLKLIAACQNQELQIWDVLTGKKDKTLTGRSSWFHATAYSSSAARLFTTSVERQLGVWNLETGQQVTTIQAHRKPFNLFLSVDQQSVITSSIDGTVKLWEVTAPTAEIAFKRLQVAQAQKLIDGLYTGGLSADQVLGEIDSRQEIDDSERGLAKAIVGIRGNDAFALGRECRLSLNAVDLDKSSLPRILEKARLAEATLPHSTFCRTTLAMAYYYDDQYALAMQYLAESTPETADSATFVNSENERTLCDLYRMMTERRLNRIEWSAEHAQRAAAILKSLSTTSLAAYSQAARRELTPLIEQPAAQNE